MTIPGGLLAGLLLVLTGCDGDECSEEAAPTDDPCTDQCSYCWVRACVDGRWSYFEAAPVKTCCDPSSPEACGDAAGCYYDPSTAEFHCRESGSLEAGSECGAMNDCESGATCLESPQGTRECRWLCDPDAVDPDSVCGDGRCVPFAEWGLDATFVVGVCVSRE